MSKLLKLFVLDNEISFGINLNKSDCVVCFSSCNHPFFRFTSLFFHSRCHSCFAEDVDRFFHVAACLVKGFFTFAHADAGSFTELLDHFWCYFLSHHVVSSSPFISRDSTSSVAASSSSPLPSETFISFLRSIIACVSAWRINLMLFKASSLHAGAE